MSRSEILRQERERILRQWSVSHQDKAKLLTSLMDIDDEIEEIRHSNLKKKSQPSDAELSA